MWMGKGRGREGEESSGEGEGGNTHTRDKEGIHLQRNINDTLLGVSTYR